MKSILVTGGAGFIGSQFVRQTIAAQLAKVIVLDSLTYAGNLGNLEEVADSALLHFYRGDIADGGLVAGLLLKHQCDAVIHFAAETHVDRSIRRPGKFVQTNVVGTCSLLDAALHHYQSMDEVERRLFRFLHVSTDEVYGQLGESGQFSETSCYAPSSPYAASKASSDHFVRAYFKTYGFPSLITNCSNNYGPFQNVEKLIPSTISKAIRGEALPVYGTGKNVRDWLHVEDHCRALLMVLESGRVGETYSIGGDSELANIDVVRQICAHLDKTIGVPDKSFSDLIRYVDDRPGHDFRYAINHSKITSELGWRPKIEFHSGIARTVDWYVQNNGLATQSGSSP